MSASKIFHPGLLKAIIEEPDLNDHRLVMADWLEEHGHLEYACFIKVQLEIDHLEGFEHEIIDERNNCTATCTACGAYPHLMELYDESNVLLGIVMQKVIPYQNISVPKDNTFYVFVEVGRKGMKGFYIGFRRGFPVDVITETHYWYKWARRLVVDLPTISKVAFMNKNPEWQPTLDGHYWRLKLNGNLSHALGKRLFNLLPEYKPNIGNAIYYKTYEAATEAISQAGMRYARGEE